MLYCCFADDARQASPTRDGCGPLVAIGGALVPGDAVKSAEDEIGRLCVDVGFPAGEEFKWSPRRGTWMWNGLTATARRDFFLAVLAALQAASATAIVVIEDASRGPANQGLTAEEDVSQLFLERVNNYLRFDHSGIVVVDRPSGDRGTEEKFLVGCLDVLRTGTRYVRHPDQLALVLTTSSHMSRLLQAADLIVSCSLARVAGESRHSLEVFDAVKPLLWNAGRIGGVGFKIQPDYTYANLYHWLLGDTVLSKGITDLQLPIPSRPYYSGPDAA